MGDPGSYPALAGQVLRAWAWCQMLWVEVLAHIPGLSARRGPGYVEGGEKGELTFQDVGTGEPRGEERGLAGDAPPITHLTAGAPPQGADPWGQANRQVVPIQRTANSDGQGVGTREPSRGTPIPGQGSDGT